MVACVQSLRYSGRAIDIGILNGTMASASIKIDERSKPDLWRWRWRTRLSPLGRVFTRAGFGIKLVYPRSLVGEGDRRKKGQPLAYSRKECEYRTDVAGICMCSFHDQALGSS